MLRRGLRRPPEARSSSPGYAGLRRRTAALAKEIGGRNRARDSHQEGQEEAFLDATAHCLEAALRVALNVCLGHQNPLTASVRIGQIGDRAADAEAIADMVQPKSAIKGRGAFDEP
jgi:hypothetical protein